MRFNQHQDCTCTLDDVTCLARVAVGHLRTRFPDLASEMPVPVADLAKALGIKIESRSNLSVTAKLTRSGHGIPERITIRSDLSTPMRRFAIAHELGHAALSIWGPSIFRTMRAQEREFFADAFASLLQVPDQHRSILAASLRSASSPLDAINAARIYGMLPERMLWYCWRELNVLEGTSRMWLRLIERPRRSGGMVRLRIARVYCDRAMFFVPNNRSFEGFAGEVGWLSDMLPGDERAKRGEVVLKSRREGDRKWGDFKFEAMLVATKIRPSAGRTGNRFIVFVSPASAEGRI